MSYRQDADIKSPYGKIIKIKDFLSNDLSSIIANFAKANTQLAKKSNNNENTSFVAQFVSNCESKSGREKIVKSLSSFIKVDVYGLCGNMTCNRTNQK